MDTSTEAVRALRHIEAVLDCEEAGTLNLDDLPKAAREALSVSRQEILDSSTALLAERDAAVARAEAAEAALEQAQEWNRQMVEKAASGGVLDGYREIGAKLAAAETALEEALSAADIAATAYERRMTEMALQKGEALLAQGRAEAEAKQLRKDLRRAVMRCRYMSSNPENPCLAPDAECCDCAASISAAIRTEGEG